MSTKHLIKIICLSRCKQLNHDIHQLGKHTLFKTIYSDYANSCFEQLDLKHYSK